MASSGSTVYLGSGNKVWKSTNSGFDVERRQLNLGRGDIRALLYDGTTVYAGTPADLQVCISRRTAE